MEKPHCCGSNCSLIAKLVFYDFQTAEQLWRLICEQCDVTFKPQPDRSSLYIKNGDIMQTTVVRTTAVYLGHTELEYMFFNSVLGH